MSGENTYSVHTRNPSRSSRREGVCLDGTSLGVCSIVSVSRSIFNTSKDQEKKNGNAHASSTEHAHERNMLECARDRHDDTHNGHNDREDNSTHTVIAERIQNLCSRQDVEANEQDIVGQQHEPSKLISKFTLSKGKISKVADIPDGRVLHDELVHRD